MDLKKSKRGSIELPLNFLIAIPIFIVAALIIAFVSGSFFDSVSGFGPADEEFEIGGSPVSSFAYIDLEESVSGIKRAAITLHRHPYTGYTNVCKTWIKYDVQLTETLNGPVTPIGVTEELYLDKEEQLVKDIEEAATAQYVFVEVTESSISGGDEDCADLIDGKVLLWTE